VPNPWVYILKTPIGRLSGHEWDFRIYSNDLFNSTTTFHFRGPSLKANYLMRSAEQKFNVFFFSFCHRNLWLAHHKNFYFLWGVPITILKGDNIHPYSPIAFGWSGILDMTCGLGLFFTREGNPPPPKNPLLCAPCASLGLAVYSPRHIRGPKHGLTMRPSTDQCTIHWKPVMTRVGKFLELGTHTHRLSTWFHMQLLIDLVLAYNHGFSKMYTQSQWTS